MESERSRNTPVQSTEISSEKEGKAGEDSVSVPKAKQGPDGRGQQELPNRSETSERNKETGDAGNRNVPGKIRVGVEVNQDFPLDLTTRMSRKRKLTGSSSSSSSDSMDSLSGDEGIEMQPVKRIRPSVISFAGRRRGAYYYSHHHRFEIRHSNNPDPSEHFMRALGPQLYNMIYGNPAGVYRRRGIISGCGKKCSMVRNQGVALEEQSAIRGPSVDEHFKKSLGEKTWMELQGY